MSRQYPNRPFIPPHHRVSVQMCDIVAYPGTQRNDLPADSASWQSTDPSLCMHQPTASAVAVAAAAHPLPAANDFSYFQYPPHRHALEPSVHPSARVASSASNQVADPQPPCQFHCVPARDDEPSRPLVPLSVVTAAANTAASAPHHRHYRLESPSAASFTRRPPWFDDEREESNTSLASRSSHHSHNHPKRQRSSAISTSNSQSSQSHHHHHERKRSRHDGLHNENERTVHGPQENAPQQQQQQYRPSSHHHYQAYTTHRHVQPSPAPMPRTSYIDHVPSLSRSFDQRSHAIQRNRVEHAHELSNPPPHYDLHHHHQRPVQMSSSTQPRGVYHAPDHQQFLLEPPPVALPRRQPVSSSRSPYAQQPTHHHHHHQQQQQHHRTGSAFEPTPPQARGPLFHRTSMTSHLHPRPSTSFLTDLLHRVIDAHAASYSDDHTRFHHHHHHHPPTASIDLIAYAWMSPGHDIFSLPAAFSIQFGDFFDLTIPDETPVVGLTDSELERLPTMIYSKSCTSIDADEKCAVCLSEYIGGDKLKHLRCKHFFHSDCIDPWLKTSTRCPICRGEQTN